MIRLTTKYLASEASEQRALFQWANIIVGQIPELTLLHHVPNGGKRDKVTAALLKAEGVKSGVPDVCLPVARGGYHGLYIEMKAGKNKLSVNQETWLKQLTLQGYCTAVCYGWHEAAEVITKYLKES